MSEKDQAELYMEKLVSAWVTTWEIVTSRASCAALITIGAAKLREMQVRLDACVAVYDNYYNKSQAKLAALRAENEKLQQINERLRRNLADPPPDVQELVIKKLDLVSRDAVWIEAERVTERDMQIIDDHQCQTHKEACYCEYHIARAIRAAQAKEREG